MLVFLHISVSATSHLSSATMFPLIQLTILNLQAFVWMAPKKKTINFSRPILCIVIVIPKLLSSITCVVHILLQIHYILNMLLAILRGPVAETASTNATVFLFSHMKCKRKWSSVGRWEIRFLYVNLHTVVVVCRLMHFLSIPKVPKKADRLEGKSLGPLLWKSNIVHCYVNDVSYAGVFYMVLLGS